MKELMEFLEETKKKHCDYSLCCFVYCMSATKEQLFIKIKQIKTQQKNKYLDVVFYMM